MFTDDYGCSVRPISPVVELYSVKISVEDLTVPRHFATVTDGDVTFHVDDVPDSNGRPAPEAESSPIGNEDAGLFPDLRSRLQSIRAATGQLDPTADSCSLLTMVASPSEFGCLTNQSSSFGFG